MVRLPNFGKISDYALVLIGLAILLFFTTHSIYGDGNIRYGMLRSLLSHGSLDNSPYSIIGPMFSAPLWFADKLFGSTPFLTTLYNFFLVALGVGALFYLLKGCIDGATLRLFVLIMLFASMFPAHQTAWYGEPFSALLAGIGIVGLVTNYALPGWTCLVLATINTPSTIAGLVLVSMVRVFQKQRLVYVLAPLVALLCIWAEASLRRGAPFISGYEGNRGFETILPYSGLPGFSFPFILGLLSIIFSFGKGLLWFAPGLFFPLAKEIHPVDSPSRKILKLWLIYLTGLILVYSCWWSWYGGWFWGPRFFLFASIPASFALASHIRSGSRSLLLNSTVLLALLLSFWVGASGIIYGQNDLEICRENEYALEFLCWYVPEFSVLLMPFIAARQLSGSQMALLSIFGVVFIYCAGPLIRICFMSILEKSQEWRKELFKRDKWKL